VADRRPTDARIAADLRNYRSLTVPPSTRTELVVLRLGNGADSAVSPLTVAATAAPCTARPALALPDA
jgi:hypothetical protein